jgi:hypothetical protein
MDNVQNCDSCINVSSLQANRQLTCWARSGDVICFQCGTDKPIVLSELSSVLNKGQNDE